MNEYYIKINENNYIKDIIEYPYQDYIKINLDLSTLEYMPHIGFYKWINGEVVIDETLHTEYLLKLA